MVWYVIFRLGYYFDDVQLILYNTLTIPPKMVMMNRLQYWIAGKKAAKIVCFFMGHDVPCGTYGLSQVCYSSDTFSLHDYLYVRWMKWSLKLMILI